MDSPPFREPEPAEGGPDTVVGLIHHLEEPDGPEQVATIGATVRSTRGVAVTSRLGRGAKLARLASRTVVSSAVHAARRAVTRPERRASLDRAHELRSAAQVAETFGAMRGVLMKLGQMASYLDDSLPEPLRAAMSGLQADAPPMSAELAARVVEEELGRAPDQVFASWDPAPIAAASIGQVHRATTLDGLAVAVKVQYPGVDTAVRADLANIALIMPLLHLAYPGLDARALVTELRSRLNEELDYGCEATNQRYFANWFAGHPFITVPAVLDGLSTRRVLTTELAAGVGWQDVQGWSQDERDLAAEALFRFSMRSIWDLGAFNGDPHPGNFAFQPGGRVTFLDYGLVKRLSRADMATFERMITALAVDGDMVRFREVLQAAGVLRAGPPFSDKEVADYFGVFCRLMVERGAFRVESSFASDLVRRTFDVGGPQGRIIKAANLPPSFVVLQRVNLGLVALLGQLHAMANWRAIAEECWPWVAGPPSTAMGRAEAAWLAGRRALAG